MERMLLDTCRTCHLFSPAFSCPHIEKCLCNAPWRLALNLRVLLLFSFLVRSGIDSFGQFCEFLVRLLFLLQGLLQERSVLGFPQNLCEFTRRPVGRNLVMLHPLRGSNQRSVHHGSFEILVHDFATLFDQTLHAYTLLPFGALTQRLENFFQPLYMPSCSLQMLFKALPQLIRRGRLRHF